MKKSVSIIIVIALIVGAFFLGKNYVPTNMVETKEEVNVNGDLVKVDKQLIGNGQKINVEGYIIDGQEFYKLKDLEHTLGFTSKVNEKDKVIELTSNEEIVINNFNPESFKEYDLEINYPDNRVEVEYDRTTNRIEARYIDKKSGKKIKGEEATTLIESKLLTIDYKAGEDDIINTILKNLGLEDNYKKFELDIEYADKNEFKIERIK